MILIRDVFRNVVKDDYAICLLNNLANMLTECGFLLIIEEISEEAYDSWKSELIRDMDHWKSILKHEK